MLERSTLCKICPKGWFCKSGHIYYLTMYITMFYYYLIFLNLCTAPVGSPQNFSVVAINYTTVILSWDRPIPTQENGIITLYTIIYNGSRVEKQPVSGMIMYFIFTLTSKHLHSFNQ